MHLLRYVRKQRKKWTSKNSTMHSKAKEDNNENSTICSKAKENNKDWKKYTGNKLIKLVKQDPLFYKKN